MRWGRPRRVALALAAVASVVAAFALPGAASAADEDVNCTIRVPDQPLTAQGLATPYVIEGGDQCKENNPNGAAFVQAAVVDPATGQIGVYDPLVVDAGKQPAVAPVVPTLPANGVVGIWFGFNGTNLTLRGPGAKSCVNGAQGSIFGQMAYCNAQQFFAAAHAAKVQPPPLGTAKDGKPCPSARDFSLVDQDQSDNTTDQYLVAKNGATAQDTPQNRAQLQGAGTAFNGSDERLLSIAVNKALGCQSWMAPDLADPTGTQQLTALPLNELQAEAHQQPPVAVTPAGDPMTLVDNEPNLDKLNAYRIGVNQTPVASLDQAPTKQYCSDLLNTGLPRLANDQRLTQAAPSPFPDQANNLFTFLAMRFSNTFQDEVGFLHCTTLLNVANPIELQMDGDVVVAANINLHPGPNASQPPDHGGGPTAND
jgi:hypothetical protein